MFDILKNNSENTFYAVKKEMIEKAEQDMGILIPTMLKQFYTEIGYGFIASEINNINRIMGPGSTAEFRLKTGQFEEMAADLDLDEYSIDRLFFFEAHEGLYLSIGINKKNAGKIYYYDDQIAEDLEDFFERYIRDEKYFLY